MPCEGEWLVVDADGKVGRFFTWDLGPLLESGVADLSIFHEPGELSSRFAERPLTDPEKPPSPPWFEYLDDDHEQVYERAARGLLTWDDLPSSLRDSVEPLRIPHRFAEHGVFDLGQLVSLPEAPTRPPHWSIGWLTRLDTLDVKVQRWPKYSRPFASDGDPIKVFVDGTLALVFRADEYGVSLEFHGSDRDGPRGCGPRPGGWHAKFALDDTPDEALQQAWLQWLVRVEPSPVQAPSALADEPSTIEEPAAVADEHSSVEELALARELGEHAPVADGPSPVDQPAAIGDEPPSAVGAEALEAIYQWLWEQWSPAAARSQPGHDRGPLTERLRLAYDALTADERRLLWAQQQRETTDDAPTVAEALGWSGKRVLDTYKSAKAKLSNAVG